MKEHTNTTFKGNNPKSVWHKVINDIDLWDVGWEINGNSCLRLKSQHVAVLDLSALEGQQMQGKPDWYSNTRRYKGTIGL